MPKKARAAQPCGNPSDVTRQAQDIVRAKFGDKVSLNAACRRVDFPYQSLAKILREGLPENPRVRTVQALEQLGLLELVRRARRSA